MHTHESDNDEIHELDHEPRSTGGDDERTDDEAAADTDLEDLRDAIRRMSKIRT